MPGEGLWVEGHSRSAIPAEELSRRGDVELIHPCAPGRGLRAGKGLARGPSHIGQQESQLGLVRGSSLESDLQTQTPAP